MLRNLKKIAYVMTKGPPKDSYVTIKDLAAQAKTYLACTLGYLQKDPIWDLYTEEELLIEFFAVQFFNSQEAADEFLNSINMKTGEVETKPEVIDGFSEWADAQIEKNKKDLEKNLELGGEDFEYVPPHLKGSGK